MPATAPNRRPSRTVHKAKQPDQVAVYDAKGNLVGVVDPAKIQAVASPAPDPDGAAAAKVEARFATPGSGANTAAADEAAEDLQKAVHNAQFADGFGPNDVKKAAIGTTEFRFDKLIKSLDPLAAGGVQNAVAMLALRLVGAGRLDNRDAVRLAKSAAIEAAAAELRNRARTGRVPRGTTAPSRHLYPHG
jgi:hypothetical protein